MAFTSPRLDDGLNDVCKFWKQTSVGGATGDGSQSLVNVQLDFVNVQFASEQDKRHVDADVLHVGRAPLAIGLEGEIGSGRRQLVFVKSPTGEQFRCGVRMDKVKDSVRLPRLSKHHWIEVFGNVDDGIACLIPVDVVLVAVLVTVKKIFDVLEGEQVARQVGEGSAPRR